MFVSAKRNPTIVTAGGKVIHVGDEYGGLVIVDRKDEKPVILMDELSDNQVVNLFMLTANCGSVISHDEQDIMFRKHEILIDRKNLTPLERK